MRRAFQLRLLLNDGNLPLELKGLQALAHGIAALGFRPAIRASPTAPAENISARVAESFRENRFWNPRHPFKEERLICNYGLVVRDQEELISGFEWRLFGDEHVMIGISGLVDLQFKKQSAFVEPFVHRLDELARFLYDQVHPAHGYVDEADVQNQYMRHVARRELNMVGWVNVFGPPYVERYGRDFLANLPGYKTQILPDGGVYHQLSPTFLVQDATAANALRQQVIDYCGRAGLKVTCRAPYRLRVTKRPASGSLTVEALRAYLGQLKSTTLVLKDGTRVKSIYIPWSLLTPHQEQMALDGVKAAAIDEIRQHRNRRIRFEFNIIPDALEHLLVDLFGRDNPDFEWEAVEMDVPDQLQG